MKRIPESVIQDIRNKTDIVEYVSQYVTLNQKGKNYWGLCPFHDDSNPSMSVSPEKQIYKCFVCGAGGNVFSFIQAYKNVSFIESVLELGNLNNIDMSDYQQVQKKTDPKIQKELEIMRETLNFYQFQLHTEEGSQALDRMRQRGYDEEVLKHFEVGVSLSSNSIYPFLKRKKYHEDDLLNLNIIREYHENYRDVFYDRIMFPIWNEQGYCIAYSARAIHHNNDVKYINTNDSSLFKKSKVVYNFHNAKAAARKNDFIIVVEGVIDVLAFYKAGYENVVSSLGVAITYEQIKKIKSLSNNIVLAFDGDEAGRVASYKIGQKFNDSDAKVYIWYNEDERDPDDIQREDGVQVLRQQIENRIEWLDYVFYYAIGVYGLNSFENKKRLARFVLDHLSQEDAITQDYYIKILAEKTKLDENLLKNEFSNISNKRNPSYIEEKSFANLSLPEKTILNQLLLSKNAAHIFRDELGFLLDEDAHKLSLLILDQYRIHDEISIADILILSLNERQKTILLDLEGDLLPKEYNQDILEDAMEQIKDKINDKSQESMHYEIIANPNKEDKLKKVLEKIYRKRKGDS